MFRKTLACLFAFNLGVMAVQGQQEIGFIERFATSADRRTVLNELIPGTEEFFYFYCLHFQNEGRLADAQAVLDQWRSKLGETPDVTRFHARQMLLTYGENPNRTLDYLRDKLGLNFFHAPPSKDQAAALPTRIDNAGIQLESLIKRAVEEDPSLGSIDVSGLGLILDMPLSPQQLRGLLQRLKRADYPKLVERIAEELALQDSQGFGWTGIHLSLTLAQLDELLKLRANLLENDAFVRAYAARLAPAEGTSLTDPEEMKEYLRRLVVFSRRLPASHNNFKALVLANALRFGMSQGKYDRALFLEYLALPRNGSPFVPTNRKQNREPAIEFGYSLQPAVALPPVGEESSLVRRYLEEFLKGDKDGSAFAAFLKAEYLEKVLAETKILNGIGDAATWYAKLKPADQKALRERIDLQFSPHNKNQFASTDAVSLQVDLKNVPELIIKIYQINTLNRYRNQATPISTDIDLDGLVANVERKLEFSQPADRKHTESIELNELQGPGVWVVDLLGGGQRSRAIIQKGSLVALQRLGDAGHVFQVIDEGGQVLKSAHAELNGRTFAADEEGNITIPYSEQSIARTLILVHEGFASLATFTHQSEQYTLSASFILDDQSIVAGKQALMAVRTRLSCNGHPVSIKLLENPSLKIVATDFDGISTTQVVNTLDLTDGDEFVHKFLVPSRLRQVAFELTGKVYNQSRDERQTVSANHTLQCNAIQQSMQIADLYLRKTPGGYRLLALGRNGEPVRRLPIWVSLRMQHLVQPQQFQLASDDAGVVDLGPLNHVQEVSASAENMNPVHFRLNAFHRAWPVTLHAGLGAKLVLPLGEDQASPSAFSLYEYRRGLPFNLANSKLKIAKGAVEISDLPAGNYVLWDHEGGQYVSITIANTQDRDGLLAAKHRILQAGRRELAVIRSVKVVEGKLHVEITGADPSTRVHLVADALYPEAPAAQGVLAPSLPLMQQVRVPNDSLFVDSLRLDEEYLYILERQGIKKYPGNMLAQPTLLVRPWEVSVTENADKAAEMGDAIPRMAAPEPAMGRNDADPGKMQSEQQLDWKCYDFLGTPTALVTNLEVQDGKVVYPLDGIKGYSSLSVVLVNDASVDSREITLAETDLVVRDQRLKQAFPKDKHLAQTQRIQWLAAGEKKTMGDPRTRRMQAYASIADVYRLYGTLLKNPEWDKFEFIGQWHQLSDEQKRSKYNEFACHELNFFLFNKDRTFFDRVIKPLLEQKLEKQIVDRWLLGQPLDAYDPLWRTQKLNTLERILLAKALVGRQPGTAKWLQDFVDAFPVPAQERAERFEVALRGMALEDLPGNVAMQMNEDYFFREKDHDSSAGGGTMGMGGAMGQGGYGAEQTNAGGMGGMMGGEGKPADGPATNAPGSPRGLDRRKAGLSDLALKPKRQRTAMFTSIDKTREWAETQYYRVRLQQQTAELIPTGPFWKEYFDSIAKDDFLPTSLELPTHNINEALCALAVIGLPLDGSSPDISIENDQVAISAKQPTLVFIESIEPAIDQEVKVPVLLGQDIYLATPDNPTGNMRPVTGPLLKGVPYQMKIVITNPTNDNRDVQVLTQLPAGSVPLAASKLVRNTPVGLQPYSTSQIQYAFYFPSEGEFEHYGTHVSNEGKHLVAVESKSHRVLAKPESVDTTTWAYIADWGTTEQVIEFLKSNNLFKLDLDRIAFRMHDKAVFSQVTQLLSERGMFNATLWAYSIMHNDAQQITHLLQNRQDFVANLGPAFESKLIQIDPSEQMSYEHLDYKPLVVARSHRLGPKRLILNSSLATQYNRLLNNIAHRKAIRNGEQLELCYYLILQNRIDEAIEWFEKVDSQQLATRMQYDYFNAYLGFYGGQYESAAQIANRYAEYPVLMWKDLFAQIRDQVRQRDALQQGQDITSVTSLDGNSNRAQRILTDGREARQTEAAAETPTMDLSNRDGSLSIDYRNLTDIRIHYYLMDIELLFSRNPFVSRSLDKVPVIEPNFSELIKLDQAIGSRQLELPAQLKNRNVLVEVTARGISRSTVVTANSLSLTVVEPFGRLQVLSVKGRSPVEGTYVKVYAKNRDGSIAFFKDGYTDLRGQFDYATLSTSALDQVERFAILILHPDFGAIVREAAPPTR